MGKKMTADEAREKIKVDVENMFIEANVAMRIVTINNVDMSALRASNNVGSYNAYVKALTTMVGSYSYQPKQLTEKDFNKVKKVTKFFDLGSKKDDN